MSYSCRALFSTVLSSNMKQQTHIKTILNNALSSGNKFVSIELYSARLGGVDELKKLWPPFYSFTWHDGDLTKPETLTSVVTAKKLIADGHNILMHMAGRNLNRADALTVLNRVKEIGVRNILALKGGAPPREPDDSKSDFPYAIDLVKFIKANFGDYFNIAVSGYPIGHPASTDPIKDIPIVKNKIDAGGDFVMCQAVFDAKTFRDFYKRARALNIDTPIVPGIYIINSHKLLTQVMGFCKVVPQDFLDFVNEHKDNDEAVRTYGINWAANLIGDLLTDGDTSVPGVHIFSFNNFDLVQEVYKKLDFERLKIQKFEWSSNQ